MAMHRTGWGRAEQAAPFYSVQATGKGAQTRNWQMGRAEAIVRRMGLGG